MLTEVEARNKAVKKTKYCYVLAIAWEGEPKNSVCLERIFVRGGEEEIRLAWWKNGRQGTRPADIEARDWLTLFARAIKEGVFTDGEQLGMLNTLLEQGEHISARKQEQF